MMKQLLAAFFACAATLAHAQQPSDMRIVGIEHQGAGCPAGSVALNLSDDGHALTALFSRYYLEGGTQSQSHLQEALRQCIMTLRMQVPAGLQFSLQEVHYRGFASLKPQTMARQSSTYKWGRMDEFLPLAFLRMDGPFEGDYQSNGVMQGVTWSGCRPNQPTIATLIIRSHVAVRGRLGYISVDSFDHQITEQYRLGWRPCRVAR